MDYKEKIMAYADLIQVFSSDGDRVEELLTQKVNNSVNSDLLPFWTEVRGRVLRRSAFKELEEMMKNERKHINNIERVPDIGSLLQSPTLLEWLSYLDSFQDEVDFLMDYQKENMILEKANMEQAKKACIGALQFYNKAIADKKTTRQLIEYIPLVTWACEALMVTKQMHPAFTKFLCDSFVPILRAHRKLYLEFVDLLKREEEYLGEETKKAEEHPEEKVQSASVFNRKYKTSQEEVDVFIPKDPGLRNNTEDDPYLEGFGMSLRVLLETNEAVGPYVESAKRAWYITPFTMIHRMSVHAEMLGCKDKFVPPVSPRLLRDLSEKIYAHQKFYGETNLVTAATMALDTLILDIRDLDNRSAYEHRFIDLLMILDTRLKALVEKGLVTALVAEEAFNNLLRKGEYYGIYNSIDGKFK